MDDHEEAAAAAREAAALAEAPEDLNMAGATLHDDPRGTTVAAGLNVPALAATARALRLDERNAAAETARQQDELRRYRQDMAPLRPDQPRLREDFNRGGGRGSRRQAERRAGRGNGVSSGSERSMASSRGSLRGQPHGQYNAGVNVPDAAFTPSHRCLVQVQRALREEARLAEPSRVVMGSWTGTPFGDLHTSGRHEAAAEHLSEVGRGLQAHNLLGLANSTRQSAGLYVGQSMAVGAVRDRWYRIFDHCNARPFQEGYGLLRAMDEWLNSYVDPHAAEAMVAWLSSISWPGGAISSVHEQMDQVFRMEDTLTMDTANNAPLSRYLARSQDVRLQWVTRLSRLPSWIQVHLKTVEGRSLMTLDQAWPIWTLLQPDDERLQLTRVLPGGGRPGTRGGVPSATNSRPASAAVPRPVHLLSAPAVSEHDHEMAGHHARTLLELVVAQLPATVDAFRQLMHEYNEFERAGVSDSDLQMAVNGMHQLPHPNLAPLHSLCVVMTRFCFRCDMTTEGPPVLKDGKIYHPHLIHACPFAPSPQELANEPRFSWDTRCLGSGIGQMEAHKNLVSPNRGASFVLPTTSGATSSPAASGPYRRPGVRDHGPGLNVIQAPDTSTASLEHIQRLQATVRSQELELEVGRLSSRLNQLTASSHSSVSPSPLFHLGGSSARGYGGSFDFRPLHNMGPPPRVTPTYPPFLAPMMDSAPAGFSLVGITHEQSPIWLSEDDAARLHTAPSSLGPVPGTLEEVGSDVRPAVLAGSGPRDYYYGGLHVDGRTPLFFHPSLALGNVNGGR
jgi:hypothetical protein